MLQSGHYAKDCPQTKSKPIECVACQDTGTSYWSDGVYGACMDCDRGDSGEEQFDEDAESDTAPPFCMLDDVFSDDEYDANVLTT